MSGAMPCIRIEALPTPPPLDPDEDRLAFIIHLLERQRSLPGALTRDLIGGLIEEGRRFAQTDSGRRWRSLLASSDLATNGWSLWNMLEMDGLVAAPPADGDTPGALLEDILRTLQASRLEDLARLASASAMRNRAGHA